MRISDWSSDVCSSDLMLLIDHVNQPVGYMLSARNTTKQPVWQLGYWDGNVFASGSDTPGLKEESVALMDLDPGEKGWWKEHWLHLVFVISDGTISCYINGESRSREDMQPVSNSGILHYRLAASREDET